MNIETVQISGDGYLVNGTIFVPKAEGNRHYKMVQEWISEGNTPNPALTEDELEKQQYQEWKANRQTAVDNIEVSYNGVIFQGDEISQGRMARVIIGTTDDITTVLWTAKDNSIHELNRIDLKAILSDAVNQQSGLWNTGRPLTAGL
jgi:hypothetical protein